MDESRCKVTKEGQARADIQRVGGYCHYQAWGGFEKILNFLTPISLTGRMVIFLALLIKELKPTGIEYPVQRIMLVCTKHPAQSTVSACTKYPYKVSC